MKKLGSALLILTADIFKDALHVCLGLYKVMIPVIILVKVLTELDLLRYIAMPLQPFFNLVGLPADLGIAWVSGMVVNIYSGLLVFATLLPSLPPLSVAQTSTFAVLMLVAHSLPMEARVGQMCGFSYWGQIIFRILLAFLCGMAVHGVCTQFGLLQESAQIVMQPMTEKPSLGMWAFTEARNLFGIFWISFFLMLLHRALEYLNISAMLNALLRPLLGLLGIRPQAATTVVVAMSMGIIYGSGVILRESMNGSLNRKDVFSVISMICVAHAMIEEPLLMLLIDASMWVSVGVRLLAGLLSGFLATRVYHFVVERKTTNA